MWGSRKAPVAAAKGVGTSAEEMATVAELVETVVEAVREAVGWVAATEQTGWHSTPRAVPRDRW